jgi:uncharacterized membrane protein (TIGR02234 family)
VADAPSAESARRRAGRLLAVLAILALAGAGLAAVAAALIWWSADYTDPLTGALTVTATGAGCVPELVPLALVGLAGFGAALATRGFPRRLVGVVIGLCGCAIAAFSALQFAAPPASLVTDLTRPADPVGAAQLHPIGPVLAVVAGVLLTATGVLVVLGLGARRRLGARYDAPTRAAGRAAPATAKEAATDSAATDSAGTDPADWWKALDAGTDPTASVDEVPSGPGAPSKTGGSPHVSDDTSEGGYHNPNASRPS